MQTSRCGGSLQHQIIYTPALVGMTGFEPATTRPPDEYSTKLSYIPDSEELQIYFTAGGIAKSRGNYPLRWLYNNQAPAVFILLTIFTT